MLLVLGSTVNELPCMCALALWSATKHKGFVFHQNCAIYCLPRLHLASTMWEASVKRMPEWVKSIHAIEQSISQVSSGSSGAALIQESTGHRLMMQDRKREPGNFHDMSLSPSIMTLFQLYRKGWKWQDAKLNFEMAGGHTNHLGNIIASNMKSTQKYVEEGRK